MLRRRTTTKTDVSLYAARRRTSSRQTSALVKCCEVGPLLMEGHTKRSAVRVLHVHRGALRGAAALSTLDARPLHAHILSVGPPGNALSSAEPVVMRPRPYAACLALQFYATVRDIDPSPSVPPRLWDWTDPRLSGGSGAGADDGRRRVGSVADLMGWGAYVPCVPRPKGSSVGRKVRPERADGESPMLGTAGGHVGITLITKSGLQ